SCFLRCGRSRPPASLKEYVQRAASLVRDQSQRPILPGQRIGAQRLLSEVRFQAMHVPPTVREQVRLCLNSLRHYSDTGICLTLVVTLGSTNPSHFLWARLGKALFRCWHITCNELNYRDLCTCLCRGIGSTCHLNMKEK